MHREMLEKYETFLKGFRYGSIQGIAYVGIVLILLGVVLDYALYPDRQYLFAAVRVGISVLLYGIIVLMKTDWGKSRIQQLSFIWLLFPQLMISWMIGVTDGAASLYWAGLNLAIFASGIVLVFSIWLNIAFGGITFLFYAVACAFHQESFGLHGAFFINSVLLWMAVAISCVYSYFNESAHFMLFRVKEELASKNQQLEEANNHLANLNLIERKQAELKTQELSKFNQAIIESAPFGIAFYTANGQCIMVNEAYANFIGGTVLEVLGSDFRKSISWVSSELLDVANQAIKTGRTIKRDIEEVTAFGKKVILECIFAPIRIAGTPHLLFITNNIRDRVEAERSLQESMCKLAEKEQSKTRFLAAAGHDLRQPLAAANLYIDAMKYKALTAEQSGIVRRLEQVMSNFNDLLEALLNVSKLDAGMVKPEYTSINVADIFSWLEQSYAMLARQKQLDFRTFLPRKEPLYVSSDIGLVKTILMNLVSNAIKFTSENGVLISARRRGGEVLFQVWDTGIGIPEDSLEKIFDEFHQVNNPQRDRTQGLGLGLSIVKRALLLLESNVVCRSRLGRGSVFEFSLPLAMPVEMPRVDDVVTPPPGQDELAALVRGKRFVVVEDDTLVAEALGRSISAIQGEVKHFHNAEDALRHADAETDYYIVDHMLSGKLSGVDMLNQLRLNANKPIRAVIVSGDTSAEFIRKAGEFDWPLIHKPAKLDQLITALCGNQVQ